MRKLGKKLNTQLETIEAYACGCWCSCSCSTTSAYASYFNQYPFSGYESRYWY